MSDDEGVGSVPERPKIRGERVWLRPLEERDLDPYYRATNEHDPGWHAGYAHPMSRRGVSQWYEKTVVERHGKDGYWFAICELGSDEFAGTVWVWDIDHRAPGAEVSLFVSRPGRGLGSDAIRAATDFGFGAAGQPRLWAFTAETNQRSLRAFDANGYVVEGRLRGAGRDRDAPYDFVQLSMTREEWAALDRRRSWEFYDAP